MSHVYNHRSHGRLSIIFALPVMTGLMLSIAAPTVAAPPAGYTLAWSEEFNEGVNKQPSTADWNWMTGPNNANKELEVYENDLAHSHIVADKKATDGQALELVATNTNGYQSARLSGKHSFKYGFVEARIKLPYGQGMWPAFWMLGSNDSQVGWPACGEIDIVENLGTRKWWGLVQGTLHGPGSDPFGMYRLPEGKYFKDDYHLFQMQWQENAVSLYVDGNLFRTITPADVGDHPWPYNAPFYFILNLAVGGGWPGNPDATTTFPQFMRVDYIRVYSGTPSTPVMPTTLSAKPGTKQRMIKLTWNGGLSATSYNLYRSTTSAGDTGKPYKTLSTTYYIDSEVMDRTRYYYRVQAVNSTGLSTVSKAVSAVSPVAHEVAYDGKPQAIPGKVEIENYDDGGEGVAYHDADGINSGGKFRIDEGVDIEDVTDTGGGYDIGYTGPGQWMKYTVDVASAGTYTVGIRASAEGDGGTLHLEDANGVDLTGPVKITKTGAWQIWSTFNAKVTLPAGRQTLKLVEDTAGYNLNYMLFTKD